MNDMTANEMKALLMIFKAIGNRFNANSLSKELGLSAMGTLKILKKLHSQGVLKKERLGNADYYGVDLENEYAALMVRFLLEKEAMDSAPRIKRWIERLRRFESDAKVGILFGSVIRSEEYRDVDVFFISESFNALDRVITRINLIEKTPIHLVKQTPKDLRDNLRKKDKALLDIIRTGIVVFGYDDYMELIRDLAQGK